MFSDPLNAVSVVPCIAVAMYTVEPLACACPEVEHNKRAIAARIIFFIYPPLKVATTFVTRGSFEIGTLWREYE